MPVRKNPPATFPGKALPPPPDCLYSKAVSEQELTNPPPGGWRSELLKTEDWWAVWLGFAILLAGAALFFSQAADVKSELRGTESLHAAPPDGFKTVAWHKLSDGRAAVKAKNSPAGKWLARFAGKPRKWSDNPLESLFLGETQAEVRRASATVKLNRARAAEKTALESALAAEREAARSNFNNPLLNGRAEEAISNWRKARVTAASAKKKAAVKAYNQAGWLLALAAACAVFFGAGVRFMGGSLRAFAKGFAFVFAMAAAAYVFAGQETARQYGVGYAVWAIVLGMLVSNTVGTPRWAMPAVRTEYYIKTGLVLLGAKILFEKVLTIGAAGIVVAWVVTPTVWLVTFWFGQQVLKIASKRLNAVICSDMSVCGVSAAIATAAACKAKKEELTLAVGLSMVFTAIMMVVMPLAIKGFFPADKQLILGGAWMGGTIDATGAVAAAGAVLGEKALYVAATIKIIQNVLIGVIAFFVALYFTTKVEAAETGAKADAREIWRRFPKFILGFVAASVVFSILYSWFNAQAPGMGRALIDQGVVGGLSDMFRGWFFCLAFVSIGLATNFRELRRHFVGGKPLLLYLFGQSFNLCLTLLVAYLSFYVLFPKLTEAI